VIWLVGTALAGDVVVWHAYHGAEEKALIDAGHRYEAETGVHIDAVAVPWGGFDAKVETAVPRGNGPDLLVTAHPNIGKWAAMGVIEPFPGPIEGQRPLTIAALTLDEKLWGQPLAFKSPLLL
jgi:maltose-binding protein MalE